MARSGTSPSALHGQTHQAVRRLVWILQRLRQGGCAPLRDNLEHVALVVAQQGLEPRHLTQDRRRLALEVLIRTRPQSGSGGFARIACDADKLGLLERDVVK